MVGAKYSLITFPPTLHISLETIYSSPSPRSQSPQLIEIFISISLRDIYQQQKQESESVFQDQNESVHKRFGYFKTP